MLGLDVIRKHPLTAAGLAAIAVTALAPQSRGPGSKRPPWANWVKAGATLCLEAQGEAEAEIVARLAQAALEEIGKALAHPVPEKRHPAVRAVVRRYKRRVQRRAARFAPDKAPRRRRYLRHVAALETRIAHRHAAASADQRQGFEHALSALRGPSPT
jgi:hypothetical protein